MSRFTGRKLNGAGMIHIWQEATFSMVRWAWILFSSWGRPRDGMSIQEPCLMCTTMISIPSPCASIIASKFAWQKSRLWDHECSPLCTLDYAGRIIEPQWRVCTSVGVAHTQVAGWWALQGATRPLLFWRTLSRRKNRCWRGIFFSWKVVRCIIHLSWVRPFVTFTFIWRIEGPWIVVNPNFSNCSSNSHVEIEAGKYFRLLCSNVIIIKFAPMVEAHGPVNRLHLFGRAAN